MNGPAQPDQYGYNARREIAEFLPQNSIPDVADCQSASSRVAGTIRTWKCWT